MGNILCSYINLLSVVIDKQTRCNCHTIGFVCGHTKRRCSVQHRLSTSNDTRLYVCLITPGKGQSYTTTLIHFHLWNLEGRFLTVPQKCHSASWSGLYFNKRYKGREKKTWNIGAAQKEKNGFCLGVLVILFYFSLDLWVSSKKAFDLWNISHPSFRRSAGWLIIVYVGQEYMIFLLAVPNAGHTSDSIVLNKSSSSFLLSASHNLFLSAENFTPIFERGY